MGKKDIILTENCIHNEQTSLEFNNIPEELAESTSTLVSLLLRPWWSRD